MTNNFNDWKKADLIIRRAESVGSITTPKYRIKAFFEVYQEPAMLQEKRCSLNESGNTLDRQSSSPAAEIVLPT